MLSEALTDGCMGLTMNGEDVSGREGDSIGEVTKKMGEKGTKR